MKYKRNKDEFSIYSFLKKYFINDLTKFLIFKYCAFIQLCFVYKIVYNIKTYDIRIPYHV